MRRRNTGWLVLALACTGARPTDGSKLDQLRTLPRPIAFPAVEQVLSTPARDLGSGIHIDQYLLEPGRTILVGTPDRARVMDIQLVDPSGSQDVYREQP